MRNSDDCRFLVTGGYVSQIADGLFTDVAVEEDTLYACQFGVAKKAKLLIFDETVPWAILETFTLPTDGAQIEHWSLPLPDCRRRTLMQTISRSATWSAALIRQINNLR